MKLSSSQSVLLSIAQRIAWSDGSVSDQERDLIVDLPRRLGIKDAQPSDLSTRQSLTELAAQLQTQSDKCLAVKIAGLVAGSSRNPGDMKDINDDERVAYRELISALSLEENILEEIEWSVREELGKGGNLLKMLGEAVFGKGSWPDPSLIDSIPGMHEMQ